MCAFGKASGHAFRAAKKIDDNGHVGPYATFTKWMIKPQNRPAFFKNSAMHSSHLMVDGNWIRQGFELAGFVAPAQKTAQGGEGWKIANGIAPFRGHSGGQFCA